MIINQQQQLAPLTTDQQDTTLSYNKTSKGLNIHACACNKLYLANDAMCSISYNMDTSLS